MKSRWSPKILTYWMFIFAFPCITVLVAYIHFLPWRSALQETSLLNARQNSFIATTLIEAVAPVPTTITTAATKTTTTTATTTIHSEQENIANETFLPLIGFKDMGNKKRKVLLLIIVSTAPQRSDRRQAIRDTWWKHCIGGQVKCVFITDGLIQDHVQRNLTRQERNRYKDIELQPLRGGREFGFRFLYHIKWAMAKFDFRYLLRIDDDYFLCLKRLLFELPRRPKKNLIWGHFHCEAGITWMDEAFMIFSKDIIHKFLAQNESTMLCHPHADQQIGLWLDTISKKVFFHDTRLHDSPPASFTRSFDNIKNVCDSYLGVHGAYVDKMRYLGLNANDSIKYVHPIPKFSSFCPFTRFDPHVFNPEWRFDPRPCKDNPTWNVERKMYVGRENH